MTALAARPGREPVRSLGRRLADAALARALRLRPGRNYTVRRVAVPMRDGVELLADHYAPGPAAGNAIGTVLVRNPYERGLPVSLVLARVYAARGYHVIMQSVRGTSGSGGVFEPVVNEVADGADTVAWLRRQPWFTGSFGTIGLSYLGLTQWALLMDPPPELTAAVIAVGLHDYSASLWGTGAYKLNDQLGWSHVMARQEHGGRIRAGVRPLTARRKVARAAADLPLGAAGRALLGDEAPWYESLVEHPDLADPFWEKYRFGAALDRAQIPVLLIGGWQDVFLGQTLAQYRRLHERGLDVALTIGPWTHNQVLINGLGTVTRESLHWLDTHLAGIRTEPRRGPVRVFVTGNVGPGWRDLPAWPPATAPRQWVLQSDGGLAETPSESTGPVSFRYDPADPTPTVGGPLLSPGSGYRDDRVLAARDDVLSFTSPALTADLDVAGCPVVELTHTSDNPHVDLFVRVSEVLADGCSRNVSDGYRRLRDASGAVRLELDAIAHRFTAGSRLRLLIAGGSFPRYARNLGNGDPPVSGVRMRPARHIIECGASRLTLPVQGG